MIYHIYEQSIKAGFTVKYNFIHKAFVGTPNNFTCQKYARQIYGLYIRSGCSAVRLAYLNGVQVVAGSNPVIPTISFTHLLIPSLINRGIPSPAYPVYVNCVKL